MDRKSASNTKERFSDSWAIISVCPREEISNYTNTESEFYENTSPCNDELTPILVSLDQNNFKVLRDVECNYIYQRITTIIINVNNTSDNLL